MTWQSFLDPMFSLRVCMTLAHSIWQVALLAAIAWGLDRLWCRRSVERTYAVYVAALLAGLAAMPVTYAMVDVGPPGAATQTETVVAGLPAGPPEALRLDSGQSVIDQGEQAPKADALSPDPEAFALPSFASADEEPLARWVKAAPWIAALYAAGVSFMLVRLIRGIWDARRLCSGAQLIGDGALVERLNRLAHKWSMRIVPLLAQAEGIIVPKLVGLVRPTILLPVSAITCLSIDELEMILAHELAHVRRLDTWVNLAQRVAEAVLFFNPALWYLSRRTSALREYCCDELTCRATSGSDAELRTRYASALVRIVELARPALDSRPSTLDNPIALAASGRSPSDLRRRVARLFGEPLPEPVRLSRGGLLTIAVLAAVLLIAPTAWHSALDFAAAPTRDTTGEGEGEPRRESPPSAAGKKLQPVSMSAEEFLRLSLPEQRALLVRVFQRRMEHSKNLSYDAEETFRTYENIDGEPGRPGGTWSQGSRRQHRYWRADDSFRLDTYAYRSLTDTNWRTFHSEGVNGEEGIGRNATIDREGNGRLYGQVVYPVDPPDDDGLRHWLTRAYYSHRPGQEECLFPYLISHKDEFEIQVPMEAGKVIADMVILSFPWKPSWAKEAGGKRTYYLDPQKGFLPFWCNSRYEDPITSPRRSWRVEKFVVHESRLVGDVWMPTGLTVKVAASTVPNQIAVTQTTVSRIEHGTVTPGDIKIEFSEGMQIVDVIEGVSYAADAQGRPAGPVKVERGWKHKPPEWWLKRYRPSDTKSGQNSARAQAGTSAAQRAGPGLSMGSRLSATDREMLVTEKKEKQKRSEQIDASVKVLGSQPPASQEERIEAALGILRIHKIDEKDAAWASAIRELIRIGKPAVPTLIEELDRTERNETLRALGFVLRGIGDPRSVPAMVRAIPRLLQPARSDCGVLIEGDPELLKFMQQHDIDDETGSSFFYGRPIREIMIALQKITGETHGWEELNYTHLAEGAEQQRAQRKLFLRLAERWADWWSKNWQRHLKDESDAQFGLTRRSLDAYSRAIAEAPRRPPRFEFPCGPNVSVGGESINAFIQSFDESPSSGFLDLDSERHPSPPEILVKGAAGIEPSGELLAWAEREGVDLINIKFTPPGSGKMFYAFQPLGMKVWRIENSRFENLQKELRESKKVVLAARWEGPLVQFDEKSGRYDDKLTVSFLFITKEGTCGAIQIQSPVTRKLVPGLPLPVEGGLHYKFIYEGTRVAPVFDTSQTSERAIAGGLNWLARHQSPDGHWSLQHTKHCKGGECSGPGDITHDAGATALALLAFQGAGETHKGNGPYKSRVQNGISWLIKHQDARTGDLSAGAPQPMYSHGLATTALCEAYAMTRDKSVGEAVEKAIRFIERAQNEATGGWRYVPGEDGDTSVLGCQVMALKSAQMAGIGISPMAFKGARKYLTSVAEGKYRGLYKYQPHDQHGVTSSMTAVGTLCQQYLGMASNDPSMLEGKQHLLANLPDANLHRDIYYWHYATLAMHNFMGPEWDRWNRQIRRALIDTQCKGGCEEGSWDPEQPSADAWARAGRVYVTALSTLTLEVYCRYLPLHRLNAPPASPKASKTGGASEK